VSGAFTRAAAGLDEEYQLGAAKLDHMAAHHGFFMADCPSCAETEDPTCARCDGRGVLFSAKSWKNCGRSDCPVKLDA
jgi:hypothetical protein